MGQVVKIKSWSVCGRRKEADTVGEIGEVESSQRRQRERCCLFFARWSPPAAARKHFIPFPWPEAAVPLRPDQLCDLTPVSGRITLISRAYSEMRTSYKTAKQARWVLIVVCKCCLALHPSRTDVERSELRLCFPQTRDEWLIVVVVVGWCDCSNARVWFVRRGFETV